MRHTGDRVRQGRRHRDRRRGDDGHAVRRAERDLALRAAEGFDPRPTTRRRSAPTPRPTTGRGSSRPPIGGGGSDADREQHRDVGGREPGEGGATRRVEHQGEHGAERQPRAVVVRPCAGCGRASRRASRARRTASPMNPTSATAATYPSPPRADECVGTVVYWLIRVLCRHGRCTPTARRGGRRPQHLCGPVDRSPRHSSAGGMESEALQRNPSHRRRRQGLDALDGLAPPGRAACAASARASGCANSSRGAGPYPTFVTNTSSRCSVLPATRLRTSGLRHRPRRARPSDLPEPARCFAHEHDPRTDSSVRRESAGRHAMPEQSRQLAARAYNAVTSATIRALLGGDLHGFPNRCRRAQVP